MKKTLLLIAFAATVTFGFAQNNKKEDKKDTKKPDETGLRKIASGRGEEELSREVNESVREAMKDMKVDLDKLDINIDLKGLEVLNHLDEIIEASLEGLDEQIERSVERSLEGLDENIERSVERSLEGLDEDIDRSLRHLNDLDIDIDIDNDIDHDIDIDIDEDHDMDIDIDEDRDRDVEIDNRGVRINGMTVEEYKKQQDKKDAEVNKKDSEVNKKDATKEPTPKKKKKE